MMPRWIRACGRRTARSGLLILGGLAVLAIGCESGDRISASPVRDPVVGDLPKPAGFRLVDDRSLAHLSGQVRLAKCLYEGSTNREAVKRFYEEYMPSAGFEQRRMELEDGAYKLFFESETETCDVRISRSGLKTLVMVNLTPRPAGSTQREAPPERAAQERTAPPPRRGRSE